MKSKTKLYPYQKEGVEKIQAFRGRALLADEMGLGKTLQVLYWCKKHNKWPMTVICPAHLKWVWYGQALDHLGIHGHILNGTKVSSTSIPFDHRLTIVNYDILKAWRKYIRKLKTKTFVIDEVHYIKNLSAKRTKQVRKLTKKSKYLIGISGTPLLSRPVELFSTLNLIRPDLFPSFFDFAFHYCKPKATAHGWQYKGAENLDELHRRMRKHLMIRRLKKDVLKDLPDKTRQVVLVDLDPKDRQEYDKAETDFIHWLKAQSTSKADKAKKAEMVSKMGHLKRTSAQMKMKQVIAWIDDFLEKSDEKLVIFGIHKKILGRIYQRYKDISVRVDGETPIPKRKLAVKKFQNKKKIRLFIGNIIAAGTGLTLTAAWNTLFVEMDWVPANHTQAEDRTHRLGQKSAAFYYYLVAKDTLEEKLCRVNQQKQSIISEVMDGGSVKGELDIFDLLQKTLKKKGKKAV